MGVCNGAQTLLRIQELVPGVEGVWPTSFSRNVSEQYEARFSTLLVTTTTTTTLPECIFLPTAYDGSRIPIPTAHGEGRATFSDVDHLKSLESSGLVVLRFVDNYGHPTETYPLNPNGSPGGITGVRSPDGRVLAMMPHPERSVLVEGASYVPGKKEREAAGWTGGVGPWGGMLAGVRTWVEKNRSKK